MSMMETTMKTTKTLAFLGLLGLIAAGSAPVWSAPRDRGDAGKQERKDDRKDDLRRRFEQRFPRLHELKQRGVIGETFEGYVDFVKGRKDEAGSLIDDENNDRRELYSQIAEKEKTTPEKVAERNAQRNFAKASAGEYLREADGKWHKKGE
jgi:uncharacterized protein YdbL (DUF1318 family)